MKKNIEFCILIPVLNEIENIVELTDRIVSVIGNLNYLIVYIDDGSNDGTIEAIEKLSKQNSKIIVLKRKKLIDGCQRGGALYYGLNIISNDFNIDYWIEMDGDLSHRPEELLKLIECSKKELFDVIIVSKYLKGSKILGRNLTRNLISKLNSLIFRLFITKSLTDFSNGFRMYNRNAASLLLQKKIKYETPIYLGEVLVFWLKKGLRIGEISGTYIGRERGESTVSLQNILEGLLGAISIIMLYYRNEEF